MSGPVETATAEAASPPRRRRRVLLVVAALLVIGVLLLVVPFLGLHLATRRDITSVDGASSRRDPQRDVALVLGAGLRPDGSPSFVLRARVEAAADLYTRGLVRKLVMSGDNSLASYDEVTAMKDYAEMLGVVRADVILDYAGFRTLDSCVRIRKVFGQTRVYVVSQRFHLPRAVHLCRWAGVDTIGIVARDPRGGSSRLKSTVREVPASAIAWAEAHIFGRGPKYLGDAIDIDNPPTAALEQPGAG
jgi:vancomycin permeability regulator SanA